jgi:uncharacterized protein (DUF1800 family)
VVVATLVHDDQLYKWQPAVVVSSVTSDSFDVKVYDGWTRNSYDVNYLVMEAGVYDLGNGARFEATTVDGILAAGPRPRLNEGAALNLSQGYQQPVVVGQVMSDTVNMWSVFWACGATYRDRPGPDSIRVGRHRLSQSLRGDQPQTLGVMVFEAGQFSADGVHIDAGYTDEVVPFKNTATHQQPLTATADTAVVSSAGFARHWYLSWPSLRAASHDEALPSATLPITVDGIGRRIRNTTYTTSYVALSDGDVRPPEPPVTGPVTDVQASRFLMQAGFGGDRTAIDEVKALGFDGWISAQTAAPRSLTKPYMLSIADKRTPPNGAGVPYFRNDQYRYPMSINFSTAWGANIIYEQDQLRQKVTWALSQIMVVSASSGGLDKTGVGLADFYDTLSANALGSFEDLLVDVSLHPVMAHYLTALNNRKADPANRPGQQPDENYAREVMQLFSIGLWMLNDDGTPKTDSSGQQIPTYDNQDIQELARVFTGIMIPNHKRLGRRIGGFINTRDDLGEFLESKIAFDESEHDTGSKTLFHLHPQLTTTLPAGLTGEADIRNAIKQLAQHPNVGPFIGRRLIQALVKSNPSPAYIGRVAAVFNDNGQGQRGDMAAVVRAILLDTEARRTPQLDGNHPDGKFLEPMARIARLFRSLPPKKNTESNDRFSMGRGGTLVDLPKREFTYAVSTYHSEFLGQLPMHSPSVFNFYSPDYREGGSELGSLVTPEFQLATPANSVSLGNHIRVMLLDRYTRAVNYQLVDHHVLDLRALADLVGDTDALITEAGLLLAGGPLSDDAATVARALVDDLTARGRPAYSVAMALACFISVSPDGAVLY